MATKGRGVDELVKQYQDLRSRLEVCEGKSRQKYQEVLKLEQDLLLRGKSNEASEKRDKLMAEVLELQLRQAAIKDLMKKTRDEIAKAIPEDIEKNLQSIDNELDGLHQRLKEKEFELAKALAQACEIYEQIKGRVSVRRPDGTLKRGYPTVQIEGLSPLSGESKTAFLEELNRLREENQKTIRSKLNELSRERTRLRDLRKKDPGEILSRLLGEKEDGQQDQGLEDLEARVPWLASSKLSYSKFSQPLKPEYRDSQVPPVDHKAAKMHPGG